MKTPSWADSPIHAMIREAGLDAPNCSPSSIYLQWHGDSDDCNEPVPEEALEFVTWCEDKVFQHDVRYVRSDLVERVHESFKLETAALRRRVDELERTIRMVDRAKGRHNTEQAFRRLVALLPESASVHATGANKTKKP